MIDPAQSGVFFIPKSQSFLWGSGCTKRHRNRKKLAVPRSENKIDILKPFW